MRIPWVWIAGGAAAFGLGYLISRPATATAALPPPLPAPRPLPVPRRPAPAPIPAPVPGVGIPETPPEQPPTRGPFADLPVGAVVLANIDTPPGPLHPVGRTGAFELRIISRQIGDPSDSYVGVKTSCPFPDSLCEHIPFEASDVLERRRG